MKHKYRVTIEEWDSKHLTWRNKKRITFDEASKAIGKEILGQ